jgi:hypothetical protein
MDVPASLRAWFLVHFAVDVAAALPLLLIPTRALGLLGWTCVDPVTARLCGAALLGIGVASLNTHRYGLGGYRAMLNLNVLWSLAAIFALLAGIADGAPPAAWAFLSTFIAFTGVWSSYAIRLRQLSRAPADDDDDDGGDGDGDATAGADGGDTQPGQPVS